MSLCIIATQTMVIEMRTLNTHENVQRVIDFARNVSNEKNLWCVIFNNRRKHFRTIKFYDIGETLEHEIVNFCNANGIACYARNVHLISRGGVFDARSIFVYTDHEFRQRRRA